MSEKCEPKVSNMANRSAKVPKVLLTRVNQSGVPKILVLDHNQFNNIIGDDTKSKAIAIFVFLKKFSEKWFSHVLLLVCLIGYACIGAAIFESVEGSFEKEQNVFELPTTIDFDACSRFRPKFANYENRS